MPNIRNGQHRYIEELQALTAGSSQQLTHPWPQYTTSINLSQVIPLLQAHPMQHNMEGSDRGFSNRPMAATRRHTRNHPSALANGLVIEEGLQTELSANHLLGPVSEELEQTVHISPLGLVPKAHQINKWRMICNLSASEGHSINDGIPAGLCSLQYASVHDAVHIIRALGRDAQLIKLDLKDAYRMVPVHPADYPLLGIRWQGCTYIDRALPFGLRSALKIFSALADFIAWALFSKGIRL